MKSFRKIIPLVLSGCISDNYPMQLPTTRTERVTQVTTTGATFQATVLDVGEVNVRNFGFVWTLQNDEETSTFSDTLNVPWREEFYSLPVSDRLLRDKSYKVKFFTETERGTVFANEQEFISQGSQPPIISSIDPIVGFDGEEITIYGKNFYTDKKYVEVFVANRLANIKSLSTTTVKITIPPLTVSGLVDVKIVVDGKSIDLKDALTIIVPEITSISISEGKVSDEIEIEGKNLVRPNIRTRVDFGEANVGTDEIEVISPNLIRVKVPQLYDKNFLPPNGPSQKTVAIKVILETDITGAPRVSNSIPFTIINSWKRTMASIPVKSGNSVTFNGKIYWISSDQEGGQIQFWQFDPETYLWSPKAGIVTEASFSNVVASDSKIYCITFDWSSGMNSLWEFQVSQNNWRYLDDLAVPYPLHTSVIIEDKLYVVDYSKSMYSYDLDSNSLSTNITTSLMTGRHFMFIKIDSKIFLIMESDKVISVLEFESDSEGWNLLQYTYPLKSLEDKVSFNSFSGTSTGGIFEINSGIVYSFNPGQASPWKMHQLFSLPTSLSIGYSGDRLFLGGYETDWDEMALFELELNY